MKKINIASYLILLTCVAMLGLTTFWQYRPYVIEKVDEPLPILNANHTIKGGETIRWRAHYTIFMEGIKAESTFYLEPIDTLSTCEFKILQENSSVTRAGEVDHINSTTVVPKEFKPCMYHVRIQSIFHVNPIRTIPVNIFTEEFKVIK